jgi:hypothetical protein
LISLKSKEILMGELKILMVHLFYRLLIIKINKKIIFNNKLLMNVNIKIHKILAKESRSLEKDENLKDKIKTKKAMMMIKTKILKW